MTSENWYEMLKVTNENSANSQSPKNQNPSEVIGQKSVAPLTEEEQQNGFREEKSADEVASSPTLYTEIAAFMQTQLEVDTADENIVAGASMNHDTVESSDENLEKKSEINLNGSPGSEVVPKSETFLLKLNRTAFEILSRNVVPPTASSEKSFQLWPTHLDLAKPSARVLLLLSSAIASGKDENI